MIDAAHDALELGVNLFEAPGQVLGVLAHLQTGGRHAAGVGRLAGHERDAVLDEVIGGFGGRGHVRALSHHLAAVRHKRLGVLEQKGVLTRAGQCDIAGKLPDTAAVLGMPHGIGTGVDIQGEAHTVVVAGALLVVDVLKNLVIDALGILDPALGVGSGDDLAAELGRLLDGIDRHVTGAVHHDGLALEGVVVALEILIHEIDEAVTGRLGAGERAAEGEALAGEHAGPLVLETLVLTEHVRDLTAAHAQVASRDIGVGADVAVELGHEGLTEAHDLVVGLALGVEVRAALAAAHRQRGECVLEDLLETEEFEHAEGDSGVEAQAALVRADGGAVLHAETAVDLTLALVVDPGDAEHDHALGLHEALEQTGGLIGGIVVDSRGDRGQDLVGGLDELGLIGVALVQLGDDPIGIGHDSAPQKWEFSCVAYGTTAE